jgi:iron-sulfur cluster repair protein YtfE (RIC family)
MPLDMAAMYAVHDVLRRELEPIARVTARVGDDPRRVLRTATGWRRFKETLRAHHRTEDGLLWPALRRQLADRPDELVLLEALEAEHAAIDQHLAMIDELLDDPEAGLLRLGDLTDSLVTGLGGHLTHEEAAAIPLIERVLPAAQWAAFEQAHRRHLLAS